MPDSDLEQINADQMAQIEELQDQVASLEADVAYLESEESDPYWRGVYDRTCAAWDKWALAEPGTASPSHLDLEGRPELAELWEAVR